MGMVGSFSVKKMKKKNPGRSIFFFQKKDNQDRLNAIVRFVLSWSSMSKVLYGNKKTGLCHEKNIRAKKHLSVPHKYQMVAPFVRLGR